MSGTNKLMVIAAGSYIYGAEKVTLDVIKGLSSVGYNVQAIISGWGDGQFAAALDTLEVKYYKLKLGWYYTSKLLWSLDSLVHYPGAVIRFLRFRINFKDWPVYIISFRQVILLWPFLKKNIVFHVHDVNACFKQSRYFLKIINRKVAKFIAVSEFIKADLVTCGISPEKIEVIYNGVDILPENQIVIPGKAGLTIGIVGQVIERKGHLYLLQAFKALLKKGLNIKLIITGDGDTEFKGKLKAFIDNEPGLAKQITWRGFQNDLPNIYEGIDVLTAPTVSPEPFGLITIEANMLGIPVIVSNRGGFTETVLNGENGFLIEPGDVEALASKIEFFYNHPNEIITMGKKGRKHVIQHFDKRMMIKKIDKLVTGI